MSIKLWRSALFRSSTNIASQKSRSMKSIHIPWYQRPILHNNQYVDVQKAAMIAALFSVVSIYKWRLCVALKIIAMLCGCGSSDSFSTYTILRDTSFSIDFSLCHCSPLSRQYSMCTVWLWRHPVPHITVTISFRTNLFTSEMCTVK